MFIHCIKIYYTRPTRSTVRLILNRIQQRRALGPPFSGVETLWEGCVGVLGVDIFDRSEPERVSVSGPHAQQLIVVFSISWNNVGIACLKHDRRNRSKWGYNFFNSFSSPSYLISKSANPQINYMIIILYYILMGKIEKSEQNFNHDIKFNKIINIILKPKKLTYHYIYCYTTPRVHNTNVDAIRWYAIYCDSHWLYRAAKTYHRSFNQYRYTEWSIKYVEKCDISVFSMNYLYCSILYIISNT